MRKFSFYNAYSNMLFLVLIYLGIGAGFHLLWDPALDECRAERIERGEFVDPEMFPVLGIFFDMAAWPLHATGNISLSGTLIATPCTPRL